MSKHYPENNSFSAIKLVLFLWNNKKLLIAISVVAAIASIIFSSPFFIPPKFKSTVVLFPSSTNSVSKALLSDNQSYKQDLLRFGEEEDAEQLLQILNSSKIRDRVIEKYNLMNHYDIDAEGKFKRTLLNKTLKNNALVNYFYIFQ